ncbi:MAG: single-stranded DNA-binding protein [Lachnospiraceae bacterium]|jgi:single-strand DNA-binding protein|nr:single-stranded DNA-binding protein [Lachnospiraceae bacterium]
MNKVILMGRLTRDPDMRGEGTGLVARYTLAVDRRFSRNEENNTDFINIVVFAKGAEFAEKYLKKGTKVVVTGRIQTGSYTNKDGQKVYTTDVVAEDQEFAESKNAAGSNGGQTEVSSSNNSVQDDGDFMNISDGVKDDMPF